MKQGRRKGVEEGRGEEVEPGEVRGGSVGAVRRPEYSSAKFAMRILGEYCVRLGARGKVKQRSAGVRRGAGWECGRAGESGSRGARGR